MIGGREPYAINHMKINIKASTRHGDMSRWNVPGQGSNQDRLIRGERTNHGGSALTMGPPRVFRRVVKFLLIDASYDGTFLSSTCTYPMAVVLKFWIVFLRIEKDYLKEKHGISGHLSYSFTVENCQMAYHWKKIKKFLRAAM